MSLKTIVSSSAFLLLGECAIAGHMVVNGLKLNTKVNDKYASLEEGIDGTSETAQASSDTASDVDSSNDDDSEHDELRKEDAERWIDTDVFTKGKGLWTRILTDAEKVPSVSKEKAFVIGLLGLDGKKTTNFDKTWESHRIQQIIDTEPILQLKDMFNTEWQLNTDTNAQKEEGEGKAYISYLIKAPVDLDNEASNAYQYNSSKDFERTLALKNIESRWIVTPLGYKHITMAETSTKDMFTMSCGSLDLKCQAEKVGLWGITKYLGVKPNSVPINLKVERELVLLGGEIMLRQKIMYGINGDVSFPNAIEHWFRQVQYQFQ